VVHGELQECFLDILERRHLHRTPTETFQKQQNLVATEEIENLWQQGVLRGQEQNGIHRINTTERLPILHEFLRCVSHVSSFYTFAVAACEGVM
jgi:hypothetical protein